jgi:hypothetical protein
MSEVATRFEPVIVGPTREDELLAAFRKSALTAPGLRQRIIKPREKVLGLWWREADLGFLFAPRGRGKTWFSMGAAKAIAAGQPFGPWETTRARRVLYVDGEMNLDDTRDRESLLPGPPCEDLIFLHHQALYDDGSESLDLASPDAQRALSALIEERNVEVLFLDNLSCLFRRVAEDKADAWEAILPWLLDLRRQNVSVCIVHHSGRNHRDMRGTSKREDAALWIMRLDEPVAGEPDEGARFVAKLTKNRNSTSRDCPPIELAFLPCIGGTLQITHQAITTFERFRIAVRDHGLSRATEIASHLEVTAGTVSKLAAKAAEAGWLRIEGRSYHYAADE